MKKLIVLLILYLSQVLVCQTSLNSRRHLKEDLNPFVESAESLNEFPRFDTSGRSQLQTSFSNSAEFIHSKRVAGKSEGDLSNTEFRLIICLRKKRRFTEVFIGSSSQQLIGCIAV
jgi:hypothetical protein